MNRLRTAVLILFAITAAAYGYMKISERLADDTPPVITADSDTVEVSVNDGEEKLLYGIKATDRQDGDLTASVTVSGISKLISENTAKVSYIVFDSDRRIGTYTRYVRYTDYRRPRFELKKPLSFSKSDDITLSGRLYAYDVIDGDISGSVKVSARDLTVSDNGVYSITVQVTNSLGDTSSVRLPVAISANPAADPQIELSSYLVFVGKGGAFDAMSYVQSVTEPSGTAGDSSKVTCTGSVDTGTPGTYNVTYNYTDSSGRAGSVILAVVVEEGNQA